MALVQRGLRHDTEVLIRQIDGRLATLRAGATSDVWLAESIAQVLRTLVVDTTRASAADRARVRAAVHYFMVRRNGRNERRPARAITEDVRVVNEIVRDLGRPDLTLAPEPRQAPVLALA
jgi:hypothetical protein